MTMHMSKWINSFSVWNNVYTNQWVCSSVQTIDQLGDHFIIMWSLIYVPLESEMYKEQGKDFVDAMKDVGLVSFLQLMVE